MPLVSGLPSPPIRKCPRQAPLFIPLTDDDDPALPPSKPELESPEVSVLQAFVLALMSLL